MDRKIQKSHPQQTVHLLRSIFSLDLLRKFRISSNLVNLSGFPISNMQLSSLYRETNLLLL